MDLAARRLRGGAVNGFGPRAHGRHTGYLWSWTNIYTGGKYVADGKWDPDHVDEQCGMVPMMAALLSAGRRMRLSAGRSLDASLALADAPPWSVALGSAGPEPLPKGPPARGGGPRGGGARGGGGPGRLRGGAPPPPPRPRPPAREGKGAGIRGGRPRSRRPQSRCRLPICRRCSTPT